MDFRLKDGEQIRTTIATKASATVIEAGDLVAMGGDYNIIKGTAAAVAVAWCPNGAPAGVTDVEITVGNDFTLIGTGENVFADSQKGYEADLVISSTVQLIDNNASSNDLLKISVAKDAGVVGSTADIMVRINKPLF